MAVTNLATSTLAELLNLPERTLRAVLVLQGGKPPLLRVTRLLDETDLKPTIERFELRKISDANA